MQRSIALLLAICLLPITSAFAIDAENEPTPLPADVWTVTFYWNHPEAPTDGVYSEVLVPDGGLVPKPADPTREGWIFLGWYEATEIGHLREETVLLGISEFSAFFDFRTPITADLNLYARWELESRIPLTTKHYAYLIGDDRAYVRPQDYITRAEIATVLFRLLDSTYRKLNWTKENPFPDVYTGAWYNNAVSTIYAIGVLDGLPGGSFMPYASIRRGEFAVLVAEFFALDYVRGDDVFLDVTDHWARDAINLLAAAQILQVPEDRLFHPEAFISRAEVAAIINRVMSRLPQEVRDVNLPGVRTWRDNRSQNAWYYLDIQEATNSHDYTMKADQIHESWTTLVPSPKWAAMQQADAQPG